jgi:hypothetical protein
LKKGGEKKEEKCDRKSTNVVAMVGRAIERIVEYIAKAQGMICIILVYNNNNGSK